MTTYDTKPWCLISGCEKKAEPKRFVFFHDDQKKVQRLSVCNEHYEVVASAGKKGPYSIGMKNGKT